MSICCTVRVEMSNERWVMGDEKNALVINVKMRRMKAAPAYATLGYVGLLSCAGIISRFRRQSRLGEHVDSGLAAFRRSEASDTGQNTSQVQDAFRSLHYVAVTTCRPPLIPAVTSIPPPILGSDPMVRGARPQKVC